MKKKRNTTAIGNQYKWKTKKILEQQGWTVRYAERVTPRGKKGRRILYKREDIFGADLIAMDGKQIMFINVVFGMGHIAEHRKRFEQYPFPQHVRRVIIQWPVKHARAPIIHNCSDDEKTIL